MKMLFKVLLFISLIAALQPDKSSAQVPANLRLEIKKRPDPQPLLIAQLPKLTLSKTEIRLNQPNKLERPGLMFARKGNEGGGGGNMLAAEITRATTEFISVVRNNIELFPELNADRLADQRISILITTEVIRSCDGIGEFNAVSRKEELTSTFNAASWLSQPTWLEKVRLAGHERLVVLGLENSNRYEISNRIFEAGLNQGPGSIESFRNDACSGSRGKAKAACLDSVAEADRKIKELVMQASAGQLSIAVARIQLNALKTSYIGRSSSAKEPRNYGRSISLLFAEGEHDLEDSDRSKSPVCVNM
ncbi:MAG: hypothetical protein EOP06_03455 [Proteobacteria bacterium]|nr:MAG: hypothetical protein EOP06_03455 [Pseudomonadota bacterium]